MTIKELKEKLGQLIDPSTNETLASTNSLKHIGYDEEKDMIVLIITMGKIGSDEENQLRRAIAKLVKIDCGFKGLKLEIEETKVFGSIIKRKCQFIGIISGKGGVGKSSVAANIATSLMRKGKKIGIIDADIYGSSIPTILNIKDAHPYYNENKKIVPISNNNMEVISTEFFTEPGQPVIWRGGMLNSMLNHFFYDVAWRDDTDYVIIDFPPGTGDITLDIKTIVPQTKVIVVTTPHPSASHVAIKAGHAAKSLNHEIIGVIENMSYYFNKASNTKDFIFGEGGGNLVAEGLDTELIAQIPISTPKNSNEIFELSEENGKIYDNIADYIIFNTK